MEPQVKTQDYVRRLLQDTQMPDDEVAAHIGRSKQWVWLFRNAKIKAPSVDVMDDLHHLLTGRNLMEPEQHGKT